MQVDQVFHFALWLINSKRYLIKIPCIYNELDLMGQHAQMRLAKPNPYQIDLV